MNYLLTSDRCFSDTPGGSYRVAWELATMMAKRGHRVAMVCGSVDGDPPEGASEQEGVQVVRFRFPEVGRLNPFRWDAQLRAIRKVIAAYLPKMPWDVAHAHTLGGAAALVGCGLGAPLVYSVHSPAISEQRVNWAGRGWEGRVKRGLGGPVLRRSERRVLERADRVHVLSAYTRELLGHEYGLPILSKVSRIPWWVDTPSVDACDRPGARRALGWPAEGRVLFTLRRMVPRMGLDVMLDAFELLGPALEYTLVIAGDGPERARLMRRVEGGPLRGRVSFPGRLSERELDCAYRAADLFVLPTSELECFGLIVLEAFAHGLPVIASDCGAIPELMRPVLPEWTFPARDAAALARLVDRFLAGAQRPPPREALVGHAQERYGRAIIERSYEDLLTSVARDRERGR